MAVCKVAQNLLCDAEASWLQLQREGSQCTLPLCKTLWTLLCSIQAGTSKQ